ncbi:uncharacterized protein LOC129601553 [Paramacrobiotus metropolitanus]|uniref:uncharacterized protein LOC129601553 n=1 Tax=Paramacrobiotus metropolitanus TaxID=2943436 RepID=UPI002445B54C|nr:uncharacterized protein LOC129601553 [Paramacrobiotus metropolitanus]
MLIIRFYLELTRYPDPRLTVPKSSNFMRNILPNLDDERFRQEFRMSQSTFEIVLGKIANHQIFVSNNPKPQSSVSDQLTIALYRFGNSGNAASIGKTARRFGLSEGTVELFTRRVIAALLSLEDEVIRWPSPEEKLAIKTKIRSEYHFPNCIGFVDGTDIVLEYRPGLNGVDYFNRKRRYAIAAMIVCDADRRILFASCGYPGSVHDARVFKNSPLETNSSQYFNGDEYILGDSAYSCTTTVIPPFRKNQIPTQNSDAFNPDWNEDDNDGDNEEDAGPVQHNEDGQHKRARIMQYVLTSIRE